MFGSTRKQPWLVRHGPLLQGGVVFAIGLMAAKFLRQPKPTLPPAIQDVQTMTVDAMLTVNDIDYNLSLDNRTTLLDALREELHFTGTKKGCDHGQCGACTVLVNGMRINSCFSLAIMHDGDRITTIEGLGTPDNMHPLQAAFVAQDGFQCGYCTPGQICSAAGMLAEIKSGMPSHVTDDLTADIDFNDAEIRERMSGNICRCGAYANIVAAIAEAGNAPALDK